MKSKRIRRGRPLRQGLPPGHLLRRRNNFRRRHYQRRHVQRLANMTSGLRTARVMVQERAAAGEVEQRQASENCQRSLPSSWS